MKKSTRISAILLAVAAGAAVYLLVSQMMSGPTFRAGDHRSLSACVQAIPGEWLPGSNDYMGAQAACEYAEQRRREQHR